MVFSSVTFLFVFLPIVIILYFVPVFFFNREWEIKKKNVVLCLASLVFYAWGEPMLLSILFNYNLGIDIEKNSEKAFKRKLLMLFSVFFNLFNR